VSADGDPAIVLETGKEAKSPDDGLSELACTGSTAAL